VVSGRLCAAGNRTEATEAEQTGQPLSAGTRAAPYHAANVVIAVHEKAIDAG